MRDLECSCRYCLIVGSRVFILGVFILGCLVGCAPQSGPDKASDHRFSGAVIGAGSGAITGFQLGSGTGPGALVGAGLGAVAGGVRGAVHDIQEEADLRLQEQVRVERARGQAQATLAQQYERRLRLHPTRDIFPADVFFTEDDVELCAEGKALLREIFVLNRDRYPWSRFGVVVYSRSTDPRSDYASHLSGRRALSIANELTLLGIEPRRIEAHGLVVPQIMFVDPDDDPTRYAQAIEFVPLDREKVYSSGNVLASNLEAFKTE